MDRYDEDIAKKANAVCEQLAEQERRGWNPSHTLRTLLLDWQDAVMRKATADPDSPEEPRRGSAATADEIDAFVGSTSLLMDRLTPSPPPPPPSSPPPAQRATTRHAARRRP